MMTTRIAVCEYPTVHPLGVGRNIDMNFGPSSDDYSEKCFPSLNYEDFNTAIDFTVGDIPQFIR